MDLGSKIEHAARVMGIDLDADPDDLHMEAATATAEFSRSPVFDRGALALNLAMMCDAAVDLVEMPAHFPTAYYLVESWRVSAADRYLAIYGVPFAGVPALAGEEIAPRRSPRIACGTGSESATTTAKTMR